MSSEDKNKERESAQGGAPTEGGGAAEDAEQQFYREGEAAGQEQDDEVDPELMQLPQPRRRRHPLISVAVIGLSLYLMWFMRGDITFFFQSRTPQDLGDVSQALKQGKLRPHTYVRLSGAPDRKHAVILEARLGGYESFFRLLQTKNRVFVQQHRALRNTDEVVSGTHTGELIRFSSLSYAETLAGYFAQTMNVPHDFSFAEVARAKATGKASIALKDNNGATMTLTPETQIWLNVAFPKEQVVQFSKNFYASAAEAEKQLTALGVPYAPDPEKANSWWRYVVWVDAEQLAQLEKKLQEGELHANVVRRQVTYLVRWSDLQVEGQKLLVKNADRSTVHFQLEPAADDSSQPRLKAVSESEVHLPSSAILFITASEPLKIGDDAFVLIGHKTPDDNWYYALLYLLLGVFLIINGAVLTQWLRSRRARPQR